MIQKQRSSGNTDKGERRRAQLVEQALLCIARQGYAATSMRDIAAAAGMNLGQLHYYFQTKTELVKFAILHFKQEFIQRLRDAIAANDSLEPAIAVLTEAANKGADMHRFWFDLRIQALFEPEYREVIEGIEDALRDVTSTMFERAGLTQMTALSPELSYLILEGLFFQTLQATIYGNQNAGSLMQAKLTKLLIKQGL